MKEFEIILGYQVPNPRTQELYCDMIARARQLGYNIKGLCLTENPPAPALTFAQLDARWKRKDRELDKLRSRVREAVSGADVFWNLNGANIHPAWLADFPTLNVYGCYDDPESSARLSQPVARYFDACFVGNLSCLPLYESWNVRNMAWSPLAFLGKDYDPTLTPEHVLTVERPVDIVFFGERQTPFRQGRLDRLIEAFPQAYCRGRGWPGGFVDDENRRAIYKQAKIGWNVHNSVGPVNLRFFALPANGILQICDNKCRSGQVFKLGEEIVGFDSMDECIELTRYYLEHPDERKRIAANGLKRYQTEFTEDKIWAYHHDHLKRWLAMKREGEIQPPVWETEPWGLREKGRLLARQAITRTLRSVGLQVVRLKDQKRSPLPGSHLATVESFAPYRENPRADASNNDPRTHRKHSQDRPEQPNMVALNWAVARFAGSARRIVELGGGTGCFAYEAASVPDRFVLCSDLDKGAIDWARENRARPNIEYVNRLVETSEGPFDLVVSVDVIEHIQDYRAFIEQCVALAPRAILTTPNKNRDPLSAQASPPAYYQHVREWTAGEFYWVLRVYYRSVQLYAMPDVYIPDVVPIDVTSTLTPLIAVCSDPIR